jgi:hypothetical protein
VDLDGQGYARRIEDVLLPALTSATRAAIESDLTGKGGSELVARSGDRPKFHAAHSSAALAANTFGPFLRERAGLPIAGRVFTGETSLEVKCSTGLRGTPPTLDCLVEGPEILAVESKCTETFSPHMARFKAVYADAMTRAHPTWRDEYGRLCEDPSRYRFLDAAQLIKHYLGVRATYPDRRISLVYLYWTPTNAAELAPCAIHATEIAEFSKRVADPQVSFIPMSHRELWAAWSSPGQPAWLRRHAVALQRRYDVVV